MNKETDMPCRVSLDAHRRESTPRLSYSGRLVVGGILLACTPLFFWGGPGYYSSRSFQAAWDLGHILFFLLVTFCLNDIRKEKEAGSEIVYFLAVFLFVFCTGLLIETLQMLGSNRSPGLDDMLRNQLGCLAAFAFSNRSALFAHQPARRLFRGGVVALLIVAAWPLSRALIDEFLAARQFPVLADFETPFERFRWVNIDQLQVENEEVRHGRRSVRVQLSTNKYSGVALFHFPGDWRGYRTLHWSVFNPQDNPLPINCRIHDVHHKQNAMEFSDRFNQQFLLDSGWNDLVVPLEKVRAAPKGREMDMARIEGFGLFVIQQPRAQAIYLDYVYLGR